MLHSQGGVSAGHAGAGAGHAGAQGAVGRRPGLPPRHGPWRRRRPQRARGPPLHQQAVGLLLLRKICLFMFWTRLLPRHGARRRRRPRRAPGPPLHQQAARLALPNLGPCFVPAHCAAAFCFGVSCVAGQGIFSPATRLNLRWPIPKLACLRPRQGGLPYRLALVVSASSRLGSLLQSSVLMRSCRQHSHQGQCPLTSMLAPCRYCDPQPRLGDAHLAQCSSCGPRQAPKPIETPVSFAVQVQQHAAIAGGRTFHPAPAAGPW